MRVFVGIPLPEDIRERLGGLCSGLPSARWVSAENMHITLRFIGEIDEVVVEDVDASLSEIRMPAFPISICNLGCFERGRKVHTIWAGVEETETIGRLHEKVDIALVRTGFEPEGRKFKPHITLARIRGRVPARRIGEYLQVCDGFFAGPFVADRFTLFRSHLGRGGAFYERLVDYPLEAA